MKLLFIFTVLFIILNIVNSIWIGEEFWTTIHYDGSIERGRTTDDFARFKNLRNYDEIHDFVAYLIENNQDGHYEAYGEAYIRSDGRICARFVDRVKEFGREICGGFRILSRGRYDGATPFEWQPSYTVNRHRAVEYLNHEIARIITKQGVASLFGGADLDRGTAYCVDSNGTAVHLSRHEDHDFFYNNIEILTITPGYEPKPWEWYFKGRPYPTNPPVAIKYPVILPTSDNLPHIFHSDNYDPTKIVDPKTWHKSHPYYVPKVFDDAGNYHPDYLRRLRAAGYYDPDYLKRLGTAGYYDPEYLKRLGKSGYYDPEYLKRLRAAGYYDPDYLKRLGTAGYYDPEYLKRLRGAGYYDPDYLKRLGKTGYYDPEYLQRLSEYERQRRLRENRYYRNQVYRDTTPTTVNNDNKETSAE